MSDFALTVVSFVVALGVLIVIHEYGHFWVARRCGVKVLRFSIGFGPTLWQRQGRDGTIYAVAAIPLGGFVKMVDEREEAVAEADRPYAFNRKPLRQRAAIVAAGPLANLLLAVVAYWLMFMNGVEGMRPLVAAPAAESIAHQAGLVAGDEIIAVNGRTTPTWQAALEQMVTAALLHEPLPITVKREVEQLNLTLPFNQMSGELDPQQFQALTGLAPFEIPLTPIIGAVSAGSAAERAALRSGDRMVQIDGVAIASWQQMVALIRDQPNQELTLWVEREGALLERRVRPEPHTEAGQTIGRLGVSLQVNEAELAHYYTLWQFGPLEGLTEAVAKSSEMALLTLKMLGKMITGSVSLEHLSGPITIARYAKRSAAAGVSQSLGFLALVSLSLAVLNLLPIPVLDGGHLLFYLIEAVKGSPVSESIERLGQQVGVSLLLLLTAIALYNDMMHLG